MGIPSHRWVRREATGVVGAITPWNVPHQINLAKLGPALAAGNTVVLKPAPDTPWCATVLGRLIAEETDIPAGVVNIVPSSEHTVGALLSGDPRVDQISFTGSTATGKRVMTSAAESLEEGLPRARRQVGLRDPRRRRPAGRLCHRRLHRVHPCRPGLRHHHPAARAPEPVRRGGGVDGQGAGQAPGRRPDRPRHHLRSADQRPPAGAGRGVPPSGRGRGGDRSSPAEAGPRASTGASSSSPP